MTLGIFLRYACQVSDCPNRPWQMQDLGWCLFSSGQSGNWRPPWGYIARWSCWHWPSQPGIHHLDCYYHSPSQHGGSWSRQHRGRDEGILEDQMLALKTSSFKIRCLQHLKPGKAPGPDSTCPELIIHAGAGLKSWLRGFLSSCLHHLKIPKIWRRALVVAVPKPSKPVEDPRSYRPISLLCVPDKILERLIYARVEPLIDPLLPREQAGFRRGRSTVDQITLLTQSIENAFEAKKKAGAVFIDLTAAYDTVWHRGLTCKLLRLLPDKHMVHMIMELIRSRSFTLTTGNSKPSRLRRLRNGVPQGSVLAPLLFNIYTYDIPSITSKKFTYADDLAMLHTSGEWKELERTLSQDMTTLSAYLQTWRLKLSHTKTVTAAFHLHNREAKRKLKVCNISKTLPFCPVLTYLGVKLDRLLTYRPHLEVLRKKLCARVSLLRRLVETGWGARSKTLRTAALSLQRAHTAYRQCIKWRLAHCHWVPASHSIGLPSGSFRHPASWASPPRSDTLPSQPQLPDHILHGQFHESQNVCRERLKSRYSFVPAARKLLDSLSEMDVRAAQWTNTKWDMEYSANALSLHAVIPKASSRPLGMGLPRAAWVKLNRLRSGVGRFCSSMYKWGLAPLANCECGASEQTADHIISQCPIHRAPRGMFGLMVLDDETRCWLKSLTVSIWPKQFGGQGGGSINPQPWSFHLSRKRCPAKRRRRRRCYSSHYPM